MSTTNAETTTEIIGAAGAATNTQVDASVGQDPVTTAGDTCPVCMRIDKHFQRACLPCGHTIHTDCIQGWVKHLEERHIAKTLEASGAVIHSAAAPAARPTCPVCRAEVVYPCGHAARSTQFDAGPLTLDHWAQPCADCQDDEYGYDGFSDEDGDGGDGSDNDRSSQDSGSAVS